MHILAPAGLFYYRGLVEETKMKVRELIEALVKPDLEPGYISMHQVMDREIELCTSSKVDLAVLSVYCIDKDTVCIDLGTEGD